MTKRLVLIRGIVLVTAILGTNYVVWRWFFSVNWDYWWIGVPLVMAETYSLVDSLLFGLGMWKLKERGEPPVPPEGLTVDVFIATYNEPIELVMATARAAKAIRYPHRTWVLDDGNRQEMREAAEAEGIGWITRSADWVGMPRHAKAGNLNNALLSTEGEFVLATVVLVTGLATVTSVDPLLVPAGVGLLLLVSGLSHGVRFRVLAATTSPWAAGVTRVRRARTVYVVALGAAVLVLLLDALPGVATDLGTYADARRLLDYPPPAFAVWDLLSLDAAPWLVGTLGLVAALVLVSPLLLALLHRGWWWAPLGLSWAAYAVWVGTGVEVLPLASEATLPVLLWQLPFVHGLVLGHHRASVERRGALAAGIASVAVVAYAGLVTAEVPGLAVVGALGAALLVLVTTCWRPLRLALGWLLLPVGRHPLPVVPVAVVAVVVLDVATR